MAFDGVLKFGTAIDEKGFQTGLGKLGSVAGAGMKAVAGAVTGAVTAATGAVTGLGTAAVKVGSSFDSSMAQVIATMGIARDTVQDGVNCFDLLSQAAQDAGANTTFSASEAADALNYLALAGYDAATAADALPAVLDLAAAGGLDLAYASDLATDAMAALGIEASKENLTAFGDGMAVTASKANTSVAQLGEAILTVGGTAKNLADGTTELNAALGVLANRGIKGAEGGTHLRNMILSLSAPTDTAQTALDALGVSALDASGNMRPLNETFADLSKALNGMSDGDTAAVLSDIFNKTDLAAAQALIAGCGEEFDALTAALNDSEGAMAQMAQTMNDTLEGDMKSLQSKAEALGIAVYGSLDAPLRELAQTGGQYLSELTAAFDKGGFEGAAAAIGDLMSDGVAKISGYLPKVVKLGASVLESLLTGLNEHLPEILESGEEILDTLAESLMTALPLLMEAGGQIITSLVGFLLDPERFSDMLNLGILLLSMLGQGIIDNLPMLLDAALQIIEILMQSLGDNAGELVSAAILILSMLGQFLAEHAPELTTAALELLLAIVEGLTDNSDELLLAVEEIIKALWDALSDPENQKMLIDAGFTLLVAILNGARKFGGELLGFAYDLFDASWDTLTSMDWGELGKNLLLGIINGMRNSDLGALNGIKDRLLDGVQDVFEIKSPSKLMRDEVGKYLALGIGEGFADNMPDVGRAAKDAFDGILEPIGMDGNLTISVDRTALDALEAVRLGVDPAAVDAYRAAMPGVLASDISPTPSSTYITNQTYSSITNQTTTESPDRPAPSGDIIIPVSIGGEAVETVVVSAAQRANATSGGTTL